jgi:hypothetical protein
VSDEQPDSPPEPDTKLESDDDQPDLATEVEKWKALARKHEARAKAGHAAQQRLAELEAESRNASETVDGLRERAERAELTAFRFEIAIKKGLPPYLATRLKGGTTAEIERDADLLVGEVSQEAEASTTNGPSDMRRTPVPKLRPGSVPGAAPFESDPRKLAARIPRRS